MNSVEEMKEMIREEIQSIENLKERVVFKQLMEGVFLSLYEANEQMYQRLEQRVMDDLAYDINRYLIRTGVIERAYFDKSHHLMAEMCPEDLEDSVYKISDVRNEIEVHGKIRLSTVFLQCDTLDVEKFYQRKLPFTGLIKTDREYPVEVYVEQSVRYLYEIEHLYHLFMKNGVPWTSVNAPYIFKMADVYITKIPEEIKGEDTITEFKTDFETYNAFVHYNMIPVWNVERQKLDSVGFPVACQDHKNYEHVISIRDYGLEHAYLVDEKEGIQKVRQSGKKLLVTGQISEVKKWNVFMIKSGTDNRIDKYTYPIMENLRKDRFSERFQRKNEQKVKTKAELQRFIHGFGLEGYIDYFDCSLLEYAEGKNRIETYSMNFFMRDELRDGSKKKVLLLHFRKNGNEKWLLRDIASFITSEVQELYPEYLCGGIVE